MTMILKKSCTINMLAFYICSKLSMIQFHESQIFLGYNKQFNLEQLGSIFFQVKKNYERRGVF